MAARWAAAVADKFSAPLQIVHGTPDAGHLLTDAAAAILAAAIAEQRESATLPNGIPPSMCYLQMPCWTAPCASAGGQ